ncbi:PaaI family thioesterase [uncultured Castellaniella sp.]|uniref:PaaI family thioesterase n=1 Tax=uncultured Castellaniella sp. TaxID=647907 RepID=UPI00263497AF|nr:PaaI family thioesterase [uncultured Castellaniella sp.]
MAPSSLSRNAAALRDRIQDLFDRSGLMQHLGATLGDVSSGRVHVHLPFSPALTQHLGLFHAGATSAIADTAGGFAAMTQAPDGHTVLSVEFKINLLAPAQGESLEAIGQVIRKGRTLTIVQVDVFALNAGQKTPVALMQQTVMNLPDRQP